MHNISDFLKEKSHPRKQGLSDVAIKESLSALHGWDLEEDRISKKFLFNNYYETMAFVNAVAYIAHFEDHHPELVVNYNHCVVRFNTHSVNGGKGGISENDFICAAKVDALRGMHFSAAPN
ncbi:4a-hydroxytetrahydrobiopterin dehydratase [Bdellovibrio sp. 22V]|uniref:4a-hydroxytetrahydrobiopterin dehydratase n=1 Tax=Bdellovibrio TaxID=958 RepID=UPI002543137B|nr:4a-hydroxytetrahydrobiopterin dehydratase [Bdellovibrio sp. 22V]WII70795.1 4a-hydroxytetrahydrobiopterin dehydratase [Bdellovibrio sp. 22V]